MSDFIWHDDPEWVESFYGTPKTPKEQLERLNRLFDETRGVDSERGVEDPPRLGKVQEVALIAISKISKPNPKGDNYPDWYFDEEGPTWAKRSEVTKTAYIGGYHPSSENALRAGVSRAIHALCEKGLIDGLFKCWALRGSLSDGRTTTDVLGHGRSPWDANFDDERKPTLQYVGLTTEGWDTVYSLMHARINNECGD